jgi:hypothetical protein
VQDAIYRAPGGWVAFPTEPAPTGVEAGTLTSNDLLNAGVEWIYVLVPEARRIDIYEFDGVGKRVSQLRFCVPVAAEGEAERFQKPPRGLPGRPVEQGWSGDTPVAQQLRAALGAWAGTRLAGEAALRERWAQIAARLTGASDGNPAASVVHYVLATMPIYWELPLASGVLRYPTPSCERPEWSVNVHSYGGPRGPEPKLVAVSLGDLFNELDSPSDRDELESLALALALAQHPDADVEVSVERGEIHRFFSVVEMVDAPARQLALSAARELDPEALIGDSIGVLVDVPIIWTILDWLRESHVPPL